MNEAFYSFTFLCYFLSQCHDNVMHYNVYFQVYNVSEVFTPSLLAIYSETIIFSRV